MNRPTRHAVRAMLCATLCAIAWTVGAAAMNPPATEDPLDARLKRLEGELRCLVCQNQTLADSNAELAADLRREVRELAVSGKSDDEIKRYLVARYGDFVLYDPPLKGTTGFLWLGPFALLGLGGIVWWIVLRRRARTPGESPASSSDDGATRRARALLDGEDSPEEA